MQKNILKKRGIVINGTPGIACNRNRGVLGRGKLLIYNECFILAERTYDRFDRRLTVTGQPLPAKL